MLGAGILGQGSQEQGPLELGSLKWAPQKPGWRRWGGRGDPRKWDAGGDDPGSGVPGAGKGLGSPDPTVPPVDVAPPLRTRLGRGAPGEEVLTTGPGYRRAPPGSRRARSLEGCRSSRAGGAAVPARPDFV